MHSWKSAILKKPFYVLVGPLPSKIYPPTSSVLPTAPQPAKPCQVDRVEWTAPAPRKK
jgi:hypothetical protein